MLVGMDSNILFWVVSLPVIWVMGRMESIYLRGHLESRDVGKFYLSHSRIDRRFAEKRFGENKFLTKWYKN